MSGNRSRFGGASRTAALMLMAAVLAACAPLSPQPAPEPDPAPPPAEEVTAPASSAVLALLDRSEGFMAAGDHDSAAASLERALRLDPQNAELWHRLARVRFAQADWAAAESLALRSVGLDATGALRRENWRLVADARRRMDDEPGAREAEARLRPG